MQYNSGQPGDWLGGAGCCILRATGRRCGSARKLASWLAYSRSAHRTGASRDRLLANSLGLVTSTTAGTSVPHTANIPLPLCSLVGSPQGEGARQAGRRQRLPLTLGKLRMHLARLANLRVDSDSAGGDAEVCDEEAGAGSLASGSRLENMDTK